MPAHVMMGYRVECPKHGAGTVVNVFQEVPNDARMPMVIKFLVHYDPQDKPTFAEVLANTDLIVRDITFKQGGP